MGKDIPYTHQKKAEVAVLISDKAAFRARKITKDKKKNLYFIMIKGSFTQQDIIILNASNRRFSKCMKQKLIQLQGKIKETHKCS